MQLTFGISSALLLIAGAHAIDVDFSSASSIKQAAKTIASNIINIYEGSDSPEIPGVFPSPYYWWEGGLAWDTLVNYWSLTGDTTYNDLVSKALLWQVGPDNNYMPPNQTSSLGNDDQSTWALAAMTAAEAGFPEPASSSGVKSWLELAHNVFDSQVARWDTKSCGGGLRWQVFTFSAGYDYKNSLSNGDFMQLAARLGHYTGNQTFFEWAGKASAWSFDVGLITNGSYNVYDGVTVSGKNCNSPTKLQWTANLGTYLSGYAYLSTTGAAPGLAEDLLGNAIKVFAKNDILTEVACASSNACNNDQLIFRTILARAMAATRDIDTSDNIDTDQINTVLRASAQGAAAQCSGGKNGTSCGSDWASSKWDGTTGLSQELSALGILLANIPTKATKTSNNTTSPGSSSTGSPSGTASSSATSPAAGTGDASSMTRSIVGVMGALAFAVALGA